MRLIGLTGPAGCGKDTVADHLVSTKAFRKVSFAQPIKDGLLAMFGWDASDLNNREWKEAPLKTVGKSPRQLMQTLGTEWGRNLVHSDIWLILARERILKYLEYHDVVVSDVRFDNEAIMIRNMGGSIVHISRPGIGSVAQHVSEAGVDIYPQDVRLSNSGTISQLLLHMGHLV